MSNNIFRLMRCIDFFGELNTADKYLNSDISDRTLNQILAAFDEQDDTLRDSKYLGRGCEKKCFIKNNDVYKIEIIQKKQLLRTLFTLSFLNLFFKRSFDADISSIKKMSNSLVYLVHKQKYVEHQYVSIDKIHDYFSKFGMSRCDEKIQYCSKYDLNSIDVSYSLSFDIESIMNFFDINDSCLREKYKTCLEKIKEKFNYEKIVFRNISSSNVTLLSQDSVVYIYDINLEFE